jgi:predicted small lipoprotein YifL
MRHLAFLIAVVLLAQGCGIKGPLYIPTPEQKRKAQERTERREAARQRESGPGTAPTAPAGATPTVAVPATAPDAPLGDEAFGPSSPPQ